MNKNTRGGIPALIIVIIAVIAIVVLAISRTHAPAPLGGNLPHVYDNRSRGFSIRLPEGFTTDESYVYQALGPGKDIRGIKFTIPTATATGTNLSTDSYISVEEIASTTACSASPFVFMGAQAQTLNDGGTTYSVATTTDAGLGNRYEESVFALPRTNPCVAVRYFIHYGVFENYPPGKITQFDKAALLARFDQIRRTLVVNQ